MSQQTVSRAERGRTSELSLETLGRILLELEAELELNVRWRGGELDRILDEGHAHLVASTIGRLEFAGWSAYPEVSYTIGRDRGSIDILAYEANSKALLVVEVKTDVTSAEATLRRHDEKVRHAAAIARARFGWDISFISRLLVVPESSSSRRRLDRHALLFDRVYPLRGVALRRWIDKPTSAAGGLLFLSPTQPASDRRDFTSRRRVRARQKAVAERGRQPHGHDRPGNFIDSTV